MSFDRADFYKSMYHTMLIAADKSVDILMTFQHPFKAVELLLAAMEECEEMYINSPIADTDEQVFSDHIPDLPDYLYDCR